MGSTKEYLGDGAYVDFDGFHVVLTTEDGMDIPTNRICLEPAVLKAFLRYLEGAQRPAIAKPKDSV